MQSQALVIVRNTVIVLAIATAYGWMSADDWEAELAQEQRARQQAEERRQWAERNQLSLADPEPEPTYQEPEATPIQAATRHVKKTAVKAKKRVKRAVKP